MGDNEALLTYACDKFEAGAYDEALEAFVLSYMKGYEQEWILENIYNCYITANEGEFQKAYETLQISHDIPYEECILDFVPYQDGSYFLFDRVLREFRGVFSVNELESTEIPPEIETDEFSPLALALDWDWRQALYVLRRAKVRDVYVVSSDLLRFLSFYKLPELQPYLGKVRVFQDYLEFQGYFHANKGVYLPKIWLGTRSEQEKIAKAINEEHAWRLTPEGRCTDNVLLTIAYPTHDRGNLMLERVENLMKIPYDAEIEVAISKNGTMLYQEEYKKVEQIEDARIAYHDHGKNLMQDQSWHYAVEMSHGKYVMLVSDEDDVITGNLGHYLRLLMDFPGASLIRAAGCLQYADITERMCKKKGVDAFGGTFLRQNYISGLIIRRQDFMDADLLSLMRLREPEHRNEYYCWYPHDCWCAILSRMGDYMEEPVRLIQEGESVARKQLEEYEKLGILQEKDKPKDNNAISSFATYEARRTQFVAELEFIRMNFPADNEYLYKGLDRAVTKLFLLLQVARKYGYEPDSFLDEVNKSAKLCMDVVQSSSLVKEQKCYIMAHINWHVEESILLHESLSEKENKKDKVSDE